jgi:UDP-2-acetamido-2-deoxy-ribo-hexuluronate aminotransferase
MRELLNHGQSGTYVHVRLGINGRLDALQAAILKVKLRHFDEEMARKRAAAEWYRRGLEGTVRLPCIKEGNESVWAQFTVASPKRETITSRLKERGIPTAIHYPRPLHAQPAFAHLKQTDADYPASAAASAQVFSLPMHPFLTEPDVGTVCAAIREAAR